MLHSSNILPIAHAFDLRMFENVNSWLNATLLKEASDIFLCQLLKVS
jgi:hypothetical protein